MPRNIYREEGPAPASDLAAGVGFVGKVGFIGFLGLILTWFLAMLPALAPMGKAIGALALVVAVGIVIIFVVGFIAWMVLKVLTWPLRLFFRARYARHVR